MEELDGVVTQLSLSAVGVRYGATQVLSDVTFTVAAGERWGVVGRNGTGKTSLFRIIKGEQTPTTGQVARQPGLRMAVLDQHREFPRATTVWSAVAESFREVIDLEEELARRAEVLSHAPATASERELAAYGRDLERFEHLGGYQYRARVDEVLEGLGFPAVAARSQLLAGLSGGERGRVALARQLAVPADVLLLDEPTNHLDLETTQWLEDYLCTTKETQLIISHDRAFLERVVNHVLHVEEGTTTSYLGRYAQFVVQRAERRLTQQRAATKQARAISREEEYIRRNLAGQNSRQAKGRRKRLASLPRLSPPPDEAAAMSIRFDVVDRGGDQVVVFQDATIGVGERVLLSKFSQWLRRHDVVGLVGPNGAGKTTLLRAMLGDQALRGGEIRLGGGIKAAVYTQDFVQVPRDTRLYDVIAELRPAWERGQVMGHLGRVQFSGDEAKRVTTSLSGGERARVALAIMMLQGANLLIFDEPTNHLDVESIEALEDAIEEYDGTVLLVSHDRELLRKLTTRVWELREGVVSVFDGTFAEWEERRAVAARAHEEEKTRRPRNGSVGAPKRQPRGVTGASSSSVRQRVAESEARVTALETRQRELAEALGDGTLYEEGSRRERIAELSRELAQVEGELISAFAAWERAVQAAEAEVARSSKRNTPKA